jgi:hypothetical protein
LYQWNIKINGDGTLFVVAYSRTLAPAPSIRPEPDGELAPETANTLLELGSYGTD